MALTSEQVDKLLQFVGTTKDDRLDCDGCLEHIAISRTQNQPIAP